MRSQLPLLRVVQHPAQSALRVAPLSSLDSDKRGFFACPEIGAVYSPDVSTVHEIETAVSKLSRHELLSFRDWFSTFDAAAWDEQFEQDVAAGHLDALANEAIRDLREGRCRDL